MKNSTHKFIIEEYLPAFEELLVFCESLQSRYSPNKLDIRVSVLRDRHQEALKAIKNLDIQTMYSKALNNRIQKFEGVLYLIYYLSIYLKDSKANPCLRLEIETHINLARSLHNLTQENLASTSMHLAHDHSSGTSSHTAIVKHLLAILELVDTIPYNGTLTHKLELVYARLYIQDLENINKRVNYLFIVFRKYQRQLHDLIYKESGILSTEQSCIEYLTSLLGSDHYFLSKYLSNSFRLKSLNI
jgi:hypothetical protein